MSQKNPQIQNAVFTDPITEENHNNSSINIASVDRFLQQQELPRPISGIGFNFTGVSSVDSKEFTYFLFFHLEA